MPSKSHVFYKNVQSHIIVHKFSVWKCFRHPYSHIRFSGDTEIVCSSKGKYTVLEYRCKKCETVDFTAGEFRKLSWKQLLVSSFFVTGVAHLMGEPIKDGSLDLGDNKNNFCTGKEAQFKVSQVVMLSPVLIVVY